MSNSGVFSIPPGTTFPNVTLTQYLQLRWPEALAYETFRRFTVGAYDHE